MSALVYSELDKWVAEMDDGSPVSAGARVVHVLAKGIYPVDLTSVPLELRHTVVLQIRELVSKASAPRPDAVPAG